jgi:hypothetical protein
MFHFTVEEIEGLDFEHYTSIAGGEIQKEDKSLTSVWQKSQNSIILVPPQVITYIFC